ncbi:LytTR family DNA-binding domain-containing protein [Ekhidna sp.]|uniref:LytR/AlgR family response regulator transcription factor n=1 Tax=Ekhidna sp. TaxID=2608089 RepID=UPI00329966A4
MDQLKTTNAEIAWREEENGVQIQISLSASDPLFNLLTKKQQTLSTGNYQNNLYVPGIFVRNGIRFDKIQYHDILYLEAQGAYTLIRTNKKDYTISRNLTQCCKELSYPFMRVHRSYTINLENIDSFSEANVFYMDRRIPVSEPYRKELLAYFNRM